MRNFTLTTVCRTVEKTETRAGKPPENRGMRKIFDVV